MRLRLENKGLLRPMRSVPRLWQRCTLDRNIGEAGILVMSEKKIEWKIIIFVIADDLLNGRNMFVSHYGTSMHRNCLISRDK